MNGGGGGFQDWAELRTLAIEAFGDTPRAETEARIISAYELHPGQVEKLILAAAVDLKEGTIRSGWAIVAKRCESLTNPPSNPTRSGGVTREKAIARAEQWMRNAGCHYPDADEAILHLCDSSGPLHTYAQAELVNDGPRTPARIQTAGDQQLIERIRALYEQERPRGLKVEADVEARALKSRQQRAKEPPRTRSAPHPSAPSSAPSPLPAGKEQPRPTASTPATSDPSTATEPSPPRTSTSTRSSPSSTPSKPPASTEHATPPTPQTPARRSPATNSTPPSPASNSDANTPL